MKSILPVILGLDPPTKEVCLIKTEKPLKGYAILINHARFPDGTVNGQLIPDGEKENVERISTVCWLQFTDAKIMRLFAQHILNFLDSTSTAEVEGQ